MHRLDPFGTMEEIGESTVHWCPSDKCRDAKASQLQSNSYVPRSTVFSSFVRVLFCSPFCSVLFVSRLFLFFRLLLSFYLLSYLSLQVPGREDGYCHQSEVFRWVRPLGRKDL